MRRRHRSPSSSPAIRPPRAPGELPDGLHAAVLAYLDRLAADEPRDAREVTP